MIFIVYFCKTPKASARVSVTSNAARCTSDELARTSVWQELVTIRKAQSYGQGNGFIVRSVAAYCMGTTTESRPDESTI